MAFDELPKNYDPAAIEAPIFKAWFDAGYFERGSRGAGVAAGAAEAEPTPSLSRLPT